MYKNPYKIVKKLLFFQKTLKSHLKTFLTRALSCLHFSRFSNTKFAFKSTLNLCNFQKLLKSLKILILYKRKNNIEKKPGPNFEEPTKILTKKNLKKTCRNHLKTFSTRNLSNIHLFQIF